MYLAANKKQIPLGNDKQRGTGKGKVRFFRFPPQPEKLAGDPGFTAE